MQNVAVTVSGYAYKRAQDAAVFLKKPVEEVINEALERGLKTVHHATDLNDVPAEMANELAAMKQLSDEALQQLARSIFPASRQKVLNRLLDKQNAGTLKESERAALQKAVVESARYVLLRSKAMALLVNRGYSQAEVLALSEKK